MISGPNSKEFAAIFDMDGVLVDTYDIMWGTHREELAKQGVHLTDRDIARYVGNSVRDNVRTWNDTYGLYIDFDSYSKYIWARQAELFKAIKPMHNLVDFLEELNRHDIPKGVGTCAHKERAEDILNNTSLKKYFPVLITSEDITNHKPHPDIYLEVAKALNMQPKNCIVFEDAKNGIEAAKAAGMRVIGYHNRHNNLEDLREADRIIDSFLEIDYGVLHYLMYHLAA